MNFKHFLLASCALIISATTATAQIPSYVPTGGLVGWWPFNGNANDESGNGNNGVVNGATLTEDRFGQMSSAYYFNGSNNGITISDATSLDLNNFSICAWVEITDFSPLAHEILTKGGDLSENYEILIYGSPTDAGAVETAIRWTNGSRSGINSSWGGANIQQNQWSLIVTTYNTTNGQCEIYINGSFVTDVNIGLTPQTNNSSLSFGFDPSAGRYHLGKIDDIAIYNRALTPQEIQNLYSGSTETFDTGNGAAPLPQGIPYQAAARDAQGQSLVNAAVNVRFTLHEGAANGAASYAETHALTTNSLGLFNTVFGNGTPEQSAFDSINWAATTKFLQVEIDLGEGYVDMGTTQLLSVPYALRSDEAARVKNAGLPIFNDNAAALAGGLVAGEMYRTSAGVLMIVY